MKVYLSYAEQDREVAGQLREKLRLAGLKPWDPGYELYPGDNWALRIGHALSTADALVVLVSPEAFTSGHVARDVEYALANRRFAGRVVPLIVRDTHVHGFLGRLPAITLAAGLESACDEIVATLSCSASGGLATAGPKSGKANLHYPSMMMRRKLSPNS